MVRESQGDSDYSNMNSAVSSESMDLAEEDMSQVDGCGLSGASEDEDECASSPAGSAYEDGADVIKSAMSDEVTKQLAAAGFEITFTSEDIKKSTNVEHPFEKGPVGMAAAAAIASSKKRKRPHSFETNPSVRKRHQNRLLRKLRQTIEEFATRVGQQAVVLVATPGKPNTSYRVFGAKPLEDVVRNLRCMIMEELENALAQQAPPPPLDDPSLFELPPLIIDGIPTPVEKMTQAQLRAFIPLMLKYSMVRGKPGWGRESTRPPWWPKDLPWANVRMDARSEDEKQKMSWTHALRQIVINCYKYHGREDLLPAFTEDDDDKQQQQASCAGSSGSPSASGASRQASAVLSSSQVCIDQMTLADVDMSQYAPAVLQTITNPDGSVSLIQVDPSNHIITLPDGTTAQVVDPQRRGRRGRGAGAGGRRRGGGGPQRGRRGHAQPRRADHPHRRGRPRLPGVGVGRDNGPGVGQRVPVHGGVHAAAGRRLRGAARAGGAERRGAGGDLHGRRRGAGHAAGRRRGAGAAGAQPQGRHRAHQGHASEVGARRGGGGLLAADAGGELAAARARLPGAARAHLARRHPPHGAGVAPALVALRLSYTVAALG